MKQVLIFTNILLLAVATFFGYKYFQPATEKVAVSKAKCTDCMEYNNVKMASTLDVNLLRAMTLNYQKDATGTIDHSKTRSVWISLEKMKQFIYEIESKTCNCPDQKLGVRVYFGVYPADQYWTTSNGFKSDLNNPNHSDGDFHAAILSKFTTNEYANRATIFMVPTMNNGQANIDFDPNRMLPGCKPGYDTTFFQSLAIKSGKLNNKEFLKGFNDPNYFTTTSLGTSVTALSATNHGDACPPPIANCQAAGSYSGFDHQ